MRGECQTFTSTPKSGEILLVISADEQPRGLHEMIDETSPRKDYLVLAHRINAKILYRTSVTRTAWKRYLPIQALQAWRAFRQRHLYRTIFTDAENIGLLLAAFFKLCHTRPRHVMLMHYASTPWKRWMVRALRLWTAIDTVICHSSAQYDLLRRWGVPAARLALIPYGVDGNFWQSLPDSTVQSPPLICSAGLEFRDYATLIEAVRTENVHLVIAAASHWSRRVNRAADVPLPSHIQVTKLDYVQLRDVYTRACFVVVPLDDVDFQAGITTILEAMAMGKAVIVSRTRGQIDTVIGDTPVPRGTPALAGYRHFYPPLQPTADAQTGIYVTPGSVSELRDAIQRLLVDPVLAQRLGRNGRQLFEQRFTLDLFVDRVAQLLLPELSHMPSVPAISLAAGQ